MPSFDAEGSFPTRHLAEWPWQWIKIHIPEHVHRVILPIGNMEAHGVLPLGTDTRIPRALADDLAEPINALVAPAVAYGLTSSLRWYPGSMTMPAPVFQAYLTQVLSGLVETGFTEVFVLNGHGGQTDEIRAAVRDVHHATAACLAMIEWWKLVPDDEHLPPSIRSGGHGGTGETAMITAIDPRLRHAELVNSTPSAPLQPGVHSYPFPASIMQLQDESLALLDPPACRSYYETIRQKMLEVMALLAKGWITYRQ